MKRTATFTMVGLMFSLAINAQQIDAYLETGVSPLHISSQYDFRSKGVPATFGPLVFKNKWGMGVYFASPASYQKENFSFVQNRLVAGIYYRPLGSFRSKKVNPVYGIGPNLTETTFTTLGYEGLTEYDKKIEKTSSLGLNLSGGIYYLIKKIVLGIDLKVAVNKQADFIAGGLVVSKFNTDQASLNLKVLLPINHWSGGGQTDCPR